MTTFTPIFGPIFWLLRSGPAQASPLRSEASRALRSRAKISEIAPFKPNQCHPTRAEKSDPIQH